MELSARNQLPGRIVAIDLGAVMAELTIDVGNGLTIAAAITRASVERMGLHEGDEVVAIVKATDVMIGKRSRS